MDKQAILDLAKWLVELEGYTLDDFEKGLDQILTAQEGEKKTCMGCKYNNEGDGYHGYYCDFHNIDNAYEAVCPDWLDKEGE